MRVLPGRSGLRTRGVPALTSLLLGLALVLPAHGAQTPDAPAASEQGDTEEAPRRRVFPPFRKRGKKAQKEAAAAPEPVATPTEPEPAVETAPEDQPAAELPDEGIWEWVDRMEGEIPTEEQIEAIEERQEIEAEQMVFSDELSGGDVPVTLYQSPREHLKTDPLFLDLVDPAEFDIPVEVNPEVEKWVRYFTGPGRKHYARYLKRSSRYRPMMYRELEKAGLPKDLVYLSMIESGYNAHAYSHAAAAGLWQFIPSTGKLYDLRIDWWMDERRDPEESVHAAIAFLGELHDMFGDWRLAWASYNGGPGRVRRATKRAGSKDFWVLARGPYLHSETDNYVPKIMAAAIIGHHPERYGFTDIDYQDELVYDVVKVEGSVELEVLAKCANTTVDEIKALNPALRRYSTPPEGADVRVPVGKKDTFAAALAKVPKSQRITVVRHTVRRGETLGRIAAKYGTSVSSISRANGLKNANRIYVGMSLRIPRGGSGAAVAAATSTSKSDARPRTSSRPSTHTVRKGENLSTIASKYGLTASQLKSYNGLSSSKILAGQKLKLSGRGGTSSSGRTSTHVVRKGESLGSIAKRYGVSTAQLQRDNGIRNASHITVGQKLKVKGGSSKASSTKSYTVQRGDSLGKIASKYGCTVSQLKAWNNLRSTTIQPGQKLVVKK